MDPEKYELHTLETDKHTLKWCMNAHNDEREQVLFSKALAKWHITFISMLLTFCFSIKRNLISLSLCLWSTSKTVDRCEFCGHNCKSYGPCTLFTMQFTIHMELKYIWRLPLCCHTLLCIIMVGYLSWLLWNVHEISLHSVSLRTSRLLWAT